MPTNNLSVQSVTVYLCLLKFSMRASHSCVTFSDQNQRKSSLWAMTKMGLLFIHL